jgi:outer membrane protein assembly factor BamB
MSSVPNPPHSPTSAQPLHASDPDRVGPFVLLGRLGAGGMGTVYLARSAGGRTVALKTVHERLAREPEFRMRFRLEAEAARTIGALHGASVVDADTQTEVPWLATEYVIGPSLAEAVAAHGPLPEPAVRALGARLARALAGIHGAGLVHRDLKPSNVLITTEGPKVIDFGIARALGAQRLTRSGQAVGTPSYMSPEQAAGRDHEPPGDMFALGGVLVFAATGHSAFPGGQAADVLYRIRYEEPDLSRVPDGLLPLLTRCLAKNPDERPGPEEMTRMYDDGAGGGPDGTAPGFAGLLPPALLADIGRRAADLWELGPPRPAEQAWPPPTVPGSAPAAGPSRRRLLLAGGGGLLALGTGGGVWAAVRSAGDGRRPRPAASRAPGMAPEPLWTYRAKEEATLVGVVGGVVGGVVLVSVGDQEDQRSMVGLDARTGKVRWKQARHLLAEDAGSGLVVRAQPTYSGADQERLLRLDPRTGELSSWGGELRGRPIQEGDLLALTGDTLYLSGPSDVYTHTVTAFAAGTGAKKWDLLLADGAAHCAVVRGDTVLLGAGQNVVAAGRADGRIRWSTRIPTSDALDAFYPSSVGGGRVHVGGHEIVTLDTATGKVLWRFGKNFNGDTTVFGTPAVHDGVVYATALVGSTIATHTHDFVAVRAADGKLLWRYALHAMTKTWPPPLFHDGVLFHDTGEVPQPLNAVDLRTHRPPWTFRSGLPDDGRAAIDMNTGRTALALTGDRLYLSCGTAVLAVPAER